MDRRDLPAEVERIGSVVLDVMYAVHSRFGPGAIESIYARAMTVGLERRGHRVQRELWIPVTFEGVLIPQAIRADLIVDETVVVELKAVEELKPVHEAQLLTYLKLGGYPLGFLMNFRVRSMKFGYERRINREALKERRETSRTSRTSRGTVLEPDEA